VATGAVLALTAVGWAYVFVPVRHGIWRRSWITATALVLASVVTLLGAGDLGEAVGTVTVDALVAGAGVGVAWVVATHVGHAVLCRILPSFVERVRDLYSIAAGDRRRDVLIALVTLAVAEEFVFRLLIQREFGLVAAVVAYTAVQAVERNWALMLAGAACGVVWGVLYGWQDGLVAPLMAHVIWTGTLTFLWPLRGCGAESLPEADEVAITGQE
jgi:membrane protease YdiL (CAAX protease family)